MQQEHHHLQNLNRRPHLAADNLAHKSNMGHESVLLTFLFKVFLLEESSPSLPFFQNKITEKNSSKGISQSPKMSPTLKLLKYVFFEESLYSYSQAISFLSSPNLWIFLLKHR